MIVEYANLLRETTNNKRIFNKYFNAKNDLYKYLINKNNIEILNCLRGMSQNRKNEYKQKYEQENRDIEKRIVSIEDNYPRLCCEMYFLLGMTYIQIADSIEKHKETVIEYIRRGIHEIIET